MTNVQLLILFFILGAITFAQRLSFIALFGRTDVPVWLIRVLRFVPPAVLCAIIFPDVFLINGALVLAPSNYRLIAAALAVAVALITRNVFVTIATGMVTLWGLTLFTA